MSLVLNTAPKSFISAVNTLALTTGATTEIATGIPDMGHYHGIPDEMEPMLISKLGKPEELKPRHTITLIPLRKRISEEIQPIADILQFRTQFKRLEELQEGLDERKSVQLKGYRTRITRFLNRLCALSGLTVQEVIEGIGRTYSDSEINRICSLEGRMGFEFLDHLAKSAINGNRRGLSRKISSVPPDKWGSDPSANTKRLAEGLFMSALVYASLDDVWGYTEADARLTDARSLFLRAGLLHSAALCIDLGAVFWDRSSHSSAPERVFSPAFSSALGGKRQKNAGYIHSAERSEINPRSYSAAWLISKSLILDKDPQSFGIRYLCGIYHAKRSAEFKAMEEIFKTSTAFFAQEDQKRNQARSHVRRAWAFVHRADLEKTDWISLSSDLRLASDLFSDSWGEKDGETALELGRLSEEASIIAERMGS